MLIRVLCWIVVPFGLLVAQPDEESRRFEQMADRYLRVLGRNPRPGTAMDHLVRHFRDAGRTQDLVKRVDAGARDDAKAQMLRGLVHDRLGNVRTAKKAYELSATRDPQDPWPRIALGDLHGRLSEWVDAAASYQRALDRKPTAAIWLEVARKLGRAWGRAARPKLAREIWQRMAQRFPDDPQVLEEVAEQLTEERGFAEAITWWRKIAALVKGDPQAHVRARVRIADLLLRTEERSEALTLLSACLDEVDPESWLGKDIMRRVERAYRAEADMDGLAGWLRKRLDARPDDLPTLIRLARLVAREGDVAEASSMFERALKKAPQDRSLHEAYLKERVRVRDHEAAVRQLTAMADVFPTDATVWKRLGETLLDEATSENRDDAEKAALEAWEKIPQLRSDDPLLSLQVAEACASEIMSPFRLKKSPLLEKAAERWYADAVVRGAGDLRYVEPLARFFLARGRKKDAIDVVRGVAKGGLADAVGTWLRVSQALGRLGLLEEALAAGAEALRANERDFDVLDNQVHVLMRLAKWEPIDALLDRLDTAATDLRQRKKALDRRVDVSAARGRLGAAAADLGRRLRQGKGTPRDQWLLALLRLKAEEYRAAIDPLRAGLEDPVQALAVRLQLAETLEAADEPAAAAAEHHRLASLRPSSAAIHFVKIAQLEAGMRRWREATAAAEEAIRRAPTNLDGYRALAEVAYRRRKPEDGIRAIRRGVMAVPTDLGIRRDLAQLLRGRKRLREAREQLWICLDMAATTQDRLAVVDDLTNLSEGKDLDRLVDRLDLWMRQADDPRPWGMCIARVREQGGDVSGAIVGLERLLVLWPDDPPVLERVAGLAAKAGSFEKAALWQGRLAKLHPIELHLVRLARYQAAAGEEDAAMATWSRLLETEAGVGGLLSVVDDRLAANDLLQATVLLKLGEKLRPDDWQILYRRAVVHAVSGQPAVALGVLDRLLALDYDITGGARAPSKPTSSPRPSRGNLPRAAPRPMLPRTASRGWPWWPSLASAKDARELRLLEQTQGILQHWTRGLAPRRSPRTPRGRPRRVPQSQGSLLAALPASFDEARVFARVGTFALALREGRRDVWLAGEFEKTRQDASRTRTLLALLASDRRWNDMQPLLERLADLDPQDGLPHLLRFVYLNATYYLRGRRPDAARSLLAQAKGSYAWLLEHRPGVASEVASKFALHLVMSGRTKDAREILAHGVRASPDLSRLAELSLLVRRLDHVSLRRAYLDRSGELLKLRAYGTAGVTDYRVLLDTILPAAAGSDADVLIDLLERCLFGVTRGASQRRHFGARGGAVMVNRGVRGTGFPYPAGPLTGVRFAALAQVWSRLAELADASGSAVPEPLLRGRLRERLAALCESASGTDAQVAHIAWICALMWDAEWTEARECMQGFFRRHAMEDTLGNVFVRGLYGHEQPGEALALLDALSDQAPPDPILRAALEKAAAREAGK
ncbi:MAG: hypothetical protein CMJ83_13800 [Planctomycetes bacterium]|nr:hypothetical protein [Planctomycetota bacterium]